MSERNIESILLEKRRFPPPTGFAARAVVDAERRRELDAEAARDH